MKLFLASTLGFWLLMLAPLEARAKPSGDDLSRPFLANEGFEAAQWAMATDLGEVLLKVAARYADTGGQVGKLEARRLDLRRQREAAEREFLDLVGDKQADLERVGSARETLASLDRQIEEVSAQIAGADPAYDELTRPSALSISTVQSLLKKDEGLLFLLPDDSGTYVFSVTQTEFQWHRADGLPTKAIATIAGELREELAATPRPDTPHKAFDRQSAFSLYSELILPVEGPFLGKTKLMTIASGPMAILPLSVLVTSAPEGKDSDYDQILRTKWFGDRYALSVLPTVSSLRALRCLMPATADRSQTCNSDRNNSPAGVSADQSAEVSKGKVKLFGVGAPALFDRVGFLKGSDEYDRAFAGPLAEPEALLVLGTLPGSKAELEDLQRLYAPFGTRLLIGKDAREATLKTSVELPRAEYVIFSTHGLLAAQSGVGEPGLVLTPPLPPAAPTTIDDGLLTAAEVAQLKLTAQFVVLSACNTASSDGREGSEGLSGLAKSFLFAGARSLLVSHWPVSDRATHELIVETFRRLENGASTDRASALQAAEKRVRKMERWAEPGFWAPFILIGLPE